MRSPLRLLLAAFAVTIAMAAAASPALAAPANDDFANSQQLAGNRSFVEIHLEDATTEAAEPLTAATDERTVWFRYSPSSNGFVTFSICTEDDFLAIEGANLSLFTGTSLGTLDQLEDSSGDCPSGQFNAAVTRAPVTAGTDYYLQVGSTAAAAFADGRLTYDFNAAIPANDDFQSPSTITGALPQTITADNGLATIETGEPDTSTYGPRNSLWYQWTPSSSGVVSIDTCSTVWSDPVHSIDSRLYVYSDANDPADLAGLELATENDDGCPEPNSLLSHVYLTVTAGTPYWIRLANFSVAHGYDYKIKLRWVGAPESILPPRIFPESLRLLAGDNFVGYAYDWTATPAVTGTSFQWERCTSAGLSCTPIPGGIYESYEGQPEDVGHRLRFSVTATNGVTSTTLHSAVSGLVEGPPPNDNFADATDLGASAPTSAADDNFFATSETGENDDAVTSVDNSVWFRWTAPATKTYFVDSCNSTLAPDFALNVYSGTEVNALAAVSEGNESCDDPGTGTRTHFAATAGTTYSIQAGSKTGEAAMEFTLSFHEVPAPSFYEAPNFSGSPIEGTHMQLHWSVLSHPITQYVDVVWTLCDAAGANCDPATGIYDNSPLLTNAMVGKRLKVTITITNPNGSTTESAITGVIGSDSDGDGTADSDDICPGEIGTKPNGCLPSEIVNDEAPAITGDTVVGKQLASSTGAWTVNHDQLSYALAYQWQRCTSALAASCSDISGATSSSHTLVAADSGRFIRVIVTASNADDETAQASAITAVITDPPVTSTPPPTPVDPFPQPNITADLPSIKLSKKNKVTLSKLAFLCGPTATGPCTGKLTIVTPKFKVKRKTIRSVSQNFDLSIAPGTRMTTTFKLSSAAAKAVRAAKKMKVRVVVSLGAPGFPVKTLETAFVFRAK